MAIDVVRARVIVGLLTSVMVLGGCDGGTADDPPPPSPERSNDAYFADTAFVGRTVAINAVVVRVITPRSFEVDARAFGDDSVLVITPAGLPVTVGERLRLLGNVEVFHYPTYRREYRLGPVDDYVEFAGEEFLSAADAGPPGLPSTATASPTERD